VRPTKYWISTAHELCDKNGDIPTANLIENWLDEVERRAWFLLKARAAPSEPFNGHADRH